MKGRKVGPKWEERLGEGGFQMGVGLLVGKGFRRKGIGGFATEGATSNRPVADDSNSVSMIIGGSS